MLSSLDSFDVSDIPSMTDRRQYEEFGEDWELPYQYQSIEEMIERSDRPPQFSKDLMKTEEVPTNFILPGYEELRELSISHAIDHGYFRDMVYSVCTECNQRYANYKYYRFMIDNERVPIDARMAARIMNYPSSMNQCCTDPNVRMRTVDEEGRAIEEIPIQMERSPRVDYSKIIIHYAMSKVMDIEPLLERLKLDRSVIEEYQVPVIDDQSRKAIDEWIANPTRELPRIRFLPYNDTKNLNHDRLCVYLRRCTSCGHRTTMAYAFYLLNRLGVSAESLFADFQILLPCCRMTFISPTFKPLPYDLDEREDFYEGIGIKFHRDRQAVQTIKKANQTITVKRMNRDDISKVTSDVDRGVIDDVM